MCKSWYWTTSCVGVWPDGPLNENTDRNSSIENPTGNVVEYNANANVIENDDEPDENVNVIAVNVAMVSANKIVEFGAVAIFETRVPTTEENTFPLPPMCENPGYRAHERTLLTHLH